MSDVLVITLLIRSVNVLGRNARSRISAIVQQLSLLTLRKLLYSTSILDEHFSMHGFCCCLTQNIEEESKCFVEVTQTTSLNKSVYLLAWSTVLPFTSRSGDNMPACADLDDLLNSVTGSCTHRRVRAPEAAEDGGAILAVAMPRYAINLNSVPSRRMSAWPAVCPLSPIFVDPKQLYVPG